MIKNICWTLFLLVLIMSSCNKQFEHRNLSITDQNITEAQALSYIEKDSAMEKALEFTKKLRPFLKKLPSDLKAKADSITYGDIIYFCSVINDDETRLKLRKEWVERYESDSIEYDNLSTWCNQKLNEYSEDPNFEKLFEQKFNRAPKKGVISMWDKDDILLYLDMNWSISNWNRFGENLHKMQHYFDPDEIPCWYTKDVREHINPDFWDYESYLYKDVNLRILQIIKYLSDNEKL